MSRRFPDTYVVGQDVARTRDRAAVVVLQRRGDTGEVLVRSAQFGVGVDLQAQEDMACNTLRALDAQTPGRDRLFYIGDRNGIGLGVVEGVQRRVMKEKSLGLRRYVKCIGGDAVAGTGHGRDDKVSWWHNVGRDLLTHRANAALRDGSLVITEAEGNGAQMLAQEIARLALKQTPSGRQRVDHRSGEHDDLYMALCWAFWLLGEFKIGGTVHSGTSWAGQGVDAGQARRRKGKQPTDGRASPQKRSGATIAAPRLAVAPSTRALGRMHHGLTKPTPVSAATSNDDEQNAAADAAVLVALRAADDWRHWSAVSSLGALHRLLHAGAVERDPARPDFWRAAVLCRACPCSADCTFAGRTLRPYAD